MLPTEHFFDYFRVQFDWLLGEGDGPNRAIDMRLQSARLHVDVVIGGPTFQLELVDLGLVKKALLLQLSLLLFCVLVQAVEVKLCHELIVMVNR